MRCSLRFAAAFVSRASLPDGVGSWPTAAPRSKPDEACGPCWSMNASHQGVSPTDGRGASGFICSMTRPDALRADGTILSRDSLLGELQRACTARRYDSPALHSAVVDFAHSARHAGLDLEWLLVAIQDALDTGLVPRLDEASRRALSGLVRDVATEAYASCHGTEAAPLRSHGRY